MNEAMIGPGSPSKSGFAEGDGEIVQIEARGLSDARSPQAAHGPTARRPSARPPRAVDVTGSYRPLGDEGGFILIAALWLLVALSAVGLHGALQMRTERLAAANLLDEARARGAALAGAEYARSRLTAAMLDRAEELRAQAQASRNRNRSRTQSVQALFRNAAPSEDSWRYPEELVVPEMVFGGARFTLHVRDTGAALNLNTADEEMLRGFLAQGLGVDYAQADRLAQAIMDWRDEDDLPRIGGGEREEYIRAGAAVLPSNQPFADVDELRQVLGMTPEIYARMLPYVALVSSGRINVNAAPEPVLLALPGMTPAAAAEIMQLRDAGNLPDDNDALHRRLSPSSRAALEEVGRRFSGRVSYRTDEVEIISDGRVDGSPVESRVRMVVTRSNTGAVVLSREFN